jgi:hypothetical protein
LTLSQDGGGHSNFSRLTEVHNQGIQVRVCAWLNYHAWVVDQAMTPSKVCLMLSANGPLWAHSRMNAAQVAEI